MLPDDGGNLVLVAGPVLLKCKLDFMGNRPPPLLLEVEPDFGLPFLLGLGIWRLGSLAERGELLPQDIDRGGLLPDLPLEYHLLHSMVS